MGQITTYLEMIKAQKQDRTALVLNGISYTYGKLAELSLERSRDLSVFPEKGQGKRKLHVIKKEKILDQLLEFLACGENQRVPLVLPFDSKISPKETVAPESACMAFATSGTSGEPKIFFRTLESWYEYFPVQNRIFHIEKDSRIFVQGSLAFTGNLNIYLAQFSVGAAVIAEDRFLPKHWAEVIEQEQADKIYLIPSKLMCLPKILKRKNERVATILSGSQSLGKKEAETLKQYYPKAEIMLYYGASELSYLTYVTDRQMTEEKNLVGKPFPGIHIFVKNGEIYVDTDYHAIGISCPYSLSDRGYFDESGNLYFCGRGEDVVEIHGRKIFLLRIENILNSLDKVDEAAVLAVEKGNKKEITAFLCMKKKASGCLEQNKIKEKLRAFLADFELPDKIVIVPEIPKKENGKTDKQKLKEGLGY